MAIAVRELKQVPLPPDTYPRPRKISREEMYCLDDAGFFTDRRVERIDGQLIDMGDQDMPPYPYKISRDELLCLEDAGFFQGQRIERIDWEILDMGTMGRRHGEGIELADSAVRTVFDTGYRVRVQLPLSPDEGNDPIPDISILRGSVRTSLPGHPQTSSLVIEVADATLVFDRGRKASLYARSGVPDYWVVDLVHRRLEVMREPIEMPEATFGWGYASIKVYGQEDEVSPLEKPEARVKVSDLLP